MIKFSLGLRAVVLLRRIARALEESNRIERFRLEREFPPERGPRKSKVSEIFTPTVEERNYQWREEQPY